MSSDQQPRPSDRPPAPLRFGRHQHILRKRDFERAFRAGSRARGQILLVVVVQNELPHSRLGLSVGRGVWKHAVRRNRVRRIFREAFRLAQHELPAGVDIVLVPASKGLELELEPTRRELVQLTRKALRRLRDKNAAAAAAAADEQRRAVEEGRG